MALPEIAPSGRIQNSIGPLATIITQVVRVIVADAAGAVQAGSGRARQP
jgi:hypothetical protein